MGVTRPEAEARAKAEAEPDSAPDALAVTPGEGARRETRAQAEVDPRISDRKHGRTISRLY